MASNRNENTSPEPLHTQDKRYSGLNRQESIGNQHQRAAKECSRILQDITGNSKGFQLKSDNQWSKNKRIPRLYYVNNKQTILIILQGDITRTKVDAIVNAANEHMTGGSGVDGIIHHAAGNELYESCKAHKQISRGVRLPTGHSRILLSYNMSSTTYYIINTAGPMYSRHAAAECARQLSSCYKTALALADLYDLESIGFTAISCGIFGYPANDGAHVALQTVDKEAKSIPVVVFVLWDNHIYDAWVEKAEELKFTPYDPESTVTANPSKSSIDNDQGKIIRSPTDNDKQQESPTRSTPPATDLSIEKTSEENIESLPGRLPSVPNEPSDTQQTEIMEQDDNSTDTKHQLGTEKTAEMTDVNPENEESKTNDNSEHLSVQEETNKSDDEKAKTEPTHNEQHNSTTTNNPEDQDNEKRE